MYVDSHEEWAGYPALILMVVTQNVHLDLLTASRPLTRSETTLKRWRRRLACYAPPAALRRLSLSPTSIGK